MKGVWGDWEPLYIFHGHSKPIASAERYPHVKLGGPQVTWGGGLGWIKVDAFLIMRRQEDF